MSFLGLDFFESKQTKKIKYDAYNNLYFPYGDKQKDKIVEILKELTNISSKEEILYNYIVVKQELMNNDIKGYNKEELKVLVNKLNSSLFNKDSSSIPYIVLALEDIIIDSNLNYSDINELKSKINAWL
ncbi:MAG: hypothetical protein Q4F12_03035 [Erysipelotrichaceae bacterium]|nr:hypothetical protein [Erysipelotrichaceae bacterium]